MKKQITTLAAIFIYFVLYAPQPLLPTFATEYGIGIAQAGTLMTATLAPLALAPLLYGYLLSAISPSRLLKYAIFLMALTCLAFAYGRSYEYALVVRLLQGLLLPAALTAISTYIGAHSPPHELQKNMSLYITGTILGGLFGRILSGVFATYFTWHIFYYCLAVVLIVTALLIPKDKNKVKVKYAQANLRSITQALTTQDVAKLCFSVFSLFFSFVALLNYLPFMVRELVDTPGNMLLGFMYCGFIMGAVSSLNAQKLITRFGDPQKVMRIGFFFFLVAIGLFFIRNIVLIFITLFLFCGAMFLVHSIAAAEVNKRSASNKSILNALYVTFYYSGGVLGSYLPGLLYEHYGNTALLISLLIVSGLGFPVLLSVSAYQAKGKNT